MFRKGFAVTDSKINYLWSLRHLEVQLVHFPDGDWFDWLYQDRRKESCCTIQAVEVTLFKVTLRIEWQ